MDVLSVPAWRDKHRLLRVEWPFCHHDHYHFEWTKDDIHEAKCWPWDLPSHLRGLVLRYRLTRGRKVVRFPKVPAKREKPMSHPALFAEMTASANAMRESNPHVLKDELRHEFNLVLKARGDNLTDEQAETLEFRVAMWGFFCHLHHPDFLRAFLNDRRLARLASFGIPFNFFNESSEGRRDFFEATRQIH